MTTTDTRRTRTATAHETAAVVHLHTGTGPKAGCWTGVIQSINAAVIVIRPYSAGCVHAATAILTASVTKVEPR